MMACQRDLIGLTTPEQGRQLTDLVDRLLSISSLTRKEAPFSQTMRNGSCGMLVLVHRTNDCDGHESRLRLRIAGSKHHE